MVALLLRALMPAGLMAAPITEGWPFQICPSGMSMQSYMALLGESQHSDHASHSDNKKHAAHAQHEGSDSEPACALNPGFTALVEEVEHKLHFTRACRARLSPQSKVRFPRASPTANRSRAPPVNS